MILVKEEEMSLIWYQSINLPFICKEFSNLHVQARITHSQQLGSTSGDGMKTCTQFFVKTSVDLIIPTSRSNENLH